MFALALDNNFLFSAAGVEEEVEEGSFRSGRAEVKMQEKQSGEFFRLVALG